jgi:hypothetical protein
VLWLSFDLNFNFKVIPIIVLHHFSIPILSAIHYSAYSVCEHPCFIFS